MSVVTKIFGTHSERELKRIYPIVDKVESYRDTMQKLSDEELKAKTESNIKEVAARGGFIINLGCDEENIWDEEIIVPKIHPLLCASAQIVPLQLLAYYTALYKGTDIDKPKNLAKSVTVE